MHAFISHHLCIAHFQTKSIYKSPYLIKFNLKFEIKFLLSIIRKRKQLKSL